jgi:NCS1 family nucleobase:cation symporter-1
MIAAAIGSFILTLVLVLNSRGATKYHIGFPAFMRVSAGFIGSRLFILVRAVVACLYFSIQTYYA